MLPLSVIHLDDAGHYLGVTTDTKWRALPRPPKGIVYVEATAERVAQLREALDTKLSAERTRLGKTLDELDQPRVAVAFDGVRFA